MFKQCIAFVTLLAVAIAKPSVGYSYQVPAATSYFTYSAPAVYPAAHYPASYPVVAKAYAPVATAAVAHTPVTTVAQAPFATTYAAAPVATTYAAAPVATTYSAASAPVVSYTGYSGYAPLAYSQYSNQLPTSFLWKKK